MFGYAVSCFLEFCWTGEVALNGKFARQYSSFRPELESFLKTSCEMALNNAVAVGGSSRSAEGDAAPAVTLMLSAKFSDFLDADAGLSFGGQLKDQSDETRAMARIQMEVPKALSTSGGMADFIKDILPLPVEYHTQFTACKAKLVLDSSIVDCTVLLTVLERVYACLCEVIPPSWISLAADVSDIFAVRLDFAGGSHRLFQGRKDLLDKFVSLRPLYALGLLRDLAQTRKTRLDVSINVLVSSLHVDVDNMIKLAEAKVARQQGLLERGTADASSGGVEPNVETTKGTDVADTTADIPKPHRVASLIPGFDALQSDLVACGNACSFCSFVCLLALHSSCSRHWPGILGILDMDSMDSGSHALDNNHSDG